MARSENIMSLHRVLSARRRPVQMLDLCSELECSASTIKRTIQKMRNSYGAPIICKPGSGYFYDRNVTFELPGVWFSAEDLHALLTMQKLAGSLSDGYFDSDIQSIQNKIYGLLHSHGGSGKEMHRIRVLGTGSRSKALPKFSVVADAVLSRKRLSLTYQGRKRGEESQRDISPQRLVHYKGNWYLDAWCHQAQALRTFAVEKIKETNLIEGTCKFVSEQVLDETLTSSYGIFSGKPIATATLLFTKEAARWVADEDWYPDVQERWLADGRYEMNIPYGNATELIMEICRYGANVEVVGPPQLRAEVLKTVHAAAKQYQS